MTKLRWRFIGVLITIPLLWGFLLGWNNFILGLGVWISLSLMIAWQVIIPQNHMGIVLLYPFERVSRVLQPGWNWVLWPIERIHAIVSTLPMEISGATTQVQSDDGVPFRFEWIVLCRLAPELIPPGELSETVPYILTT